MAELGPETEQGRALFNELLWVHGAIRRDLAVVEQLAVDVVSGAAADDVRSSITSLQTNGPLWQLKVNCLRYCQFVHGHHNLEDAMIFPTLRAANPAIAPVVDKLEADHRTVSNLLDDVESAAGALGESDSDASRLAVSESLELLAGELIAHLEYEELEAGPTMRRLTSWAG